MSLEDDAARPTQFSDSVCTCKLCNHRIAGDCMKANCICCTEINHTMVLDGIEGFIPQPDRQQNYNLLLVERFEASLNTSPMMIATMLGIDQYVANIIQKAAKYYSITTKLLYDTF